MGRPPPHIIGGPSPQSPYVFAHAITDQSTSVMSDVNIADDFQLINAITDQSNSGM